MTTARTLYIYPANPTMQEIITLHCGIENCGIHYEYKSDRKDITAIAAQWRNKKSADWPGLMKESPRVGETYELFISFALKINLSESFWVAYFDPETESNGLESESGIIAMRFCLCRKKNVIEVEKKSAGIEVEVTEIKELGSGNEVPPGSNTGTEVISKEAHAQYASAVNFENYTIINISFQGDCGWVYIVEKKTGKSCIVAENEWDFHRDTWKLTNEELSKEQEIAFGIEHSHTD